MITRGRNTRTKVLKYRIDFAKDQRKFEKEHPAEPEQLKDKPKKKKFIPLPEDDGEGLPF